MANTLPRAELAEKGKRPVDLDKSAISEVERNLVFAVQPKVMASRLGVGASYVYKMVAPKEGLLPGEEYDTERRSHAVGFALELQAAIKTGHEDKARELLQSISSAFGWDVVDEDVLARERAQAVDEFHAMVKKRALDEVRELRARMEQGELFDETDSTTGPVPVIAGERA